MPRARTIPPSRTLKLVREQHETLALQTLAIRSRLVRQLAEAEAATRPKPKPAPTPPPWQPY